MAEVLVIGKKISEMGLVNEITGEEMIPTSALGDKAVTTSQLLTYVNNNGVAQWGRIGGDITNQVDLQSQFTHERDSLKSYTQEQVSQQQEALQEHIDVTNESFDYIIKNGAALPYDESIEYAEGAPVLKDGFIQYKTENGFKSRDTVIIPTYSNVVDGVDSVTGVADGSYFNVRSPSDESYIDEYQNVGGVPKPSGKSCPSSSYVQSVADHTALPFVQSKSYDDGQTVKLDNGDIVRSTLSNNTTNPNTDMTGWINETLAIKSVNKNLFYTQAKPFTNFGVALDVAPILQAYANSLNDGDTLIIPSGKWALKSPCIITKNINIRSDGELVVSGDTNAYLKFNQPYEVELDAALHLSQLPKTGDTKLYLNAAGLALLTANPAEYFFTLNSSEVEIVRIGYADPYYKNETLTFLDSSLTVRGQIDLTYTDAAKLKIKMYRKQKPTRVQLKLSMQPNAGQTTGARILEVEGVSSILWDLVIDRSNSATIAGTSFKYKNCVSFAFLPSCQIKGGQSDASDSYAYLNEASSYIVYQGGADYYDIGTTTKKERGYAARHGKYVYFNAVNFNGIDDHYGHHYYVANMVLNNRGIGIAGGSVTLENVTQLGENFLMQNRLDTPYNDGLLRMINCHGKSGLLIAECTNNASYNSKYKTWDVIEIIDCSTDSSEDWQHGIRFNDFYAHNVNTKTKKLTIRNFGFSRLAGAAKWLQSAGEHFVDVEIDNVKLLSAGASATAAMSTGITASGCIELNRVSGLDGNWISATMDINKTKLGYSSASSLLLLSSGEMNISKTNFSDDLSSFGSASTQGAVTLLGNKINSAKYFSNANFRNAIAAGFANQVNVAINFDGDLRNYQKTKPFRYVSVNFALGTLAVGAVSTIQTETVTGARFGDVIDAVFTTNSNGLRANAWVSANDTVKYYIENPTGNPSGSQTFANIVLRLTLRSN